MTNENKELLLKDLSARLPYGVKIVNTYNELINGHLIGIKGELITMFSSGQATFNICEIKPYLRPMSSMTEEEYKEFNTQIYKANPYSDGKSYNIYEVTGLNVDWLNAHHFDYRGLIERGLAIEASKGMYNLSEK